MSTKTHPPAYTLSPTPSPSKYYVGTDETDKSRQHPSYDAANDERQRLQEEADTAFRLAWVNGQQGMARNVYRMFVDTSVPVIRECLPVV